MKQFNKTISFLSFYGIMVFLAVSLGSSVEPQKKLPKMETKKIDTLELVLDKILEIENSKTYAIGDSGRSYGCFQITKDCVKDVNDRFDTDYSHKMMFDSLRARKVAKMYILIGNENYRRKEGKEPTISVMLRNYNGGAYNGYKNEKTLKYGK